MGEDLRSASGGIHSGRGCFATERTGCCRRAWQGERDGLAGLWGPDEAGMEEQTRTFINRFLAEVEGQGKSLRQMDEVLEEGLRHKFHPGSKRPLLVADYFRGTAALELDPFRLLARIAGYGDPFDLTALRGSRAPVWPPEQKSVLDSLEDLKRAGSDGFEEIRQELRRLEHLHEDDPRASEQATWEWLAHERRPGAVVGLLSALAVHQRKAKAHALLSLGTSILGEDLDNAAGGKLTTAAGRCFITAGFAREGLHILQHFALRITDIYGDDSEHATVFFYLSLAATRIGAFKLHLRALKKAAQLGDERMRFHSLQLLAYAELNSGNPEEAARSYDSLIQQPYFAVASRQAKAAINHSRLAAKAAKGCLDRNALAEFEAAVAEVRKVLPPVDQTIAVMDFARYLRSIGRSEQACHEIEAEIWAVLELDDSGTLEKFAGLWEEFRLPRDARWSTLIGRLEAIKARGSS